MDEQTTAAAAPAAEASSEAPADFTLESAFKEAQQAVEPTVADAPKEPAQDSEQASASNDQAEQDTAQGEEPKSNRQAGREAYERGLKEGREAAQREAEQAQARVRAEQDATSSQREFEELLARAQQGDLQATDKVIGLLSSHRATQAAIQQGRNAVLSELGAEVSKSISGLEGADAEAKDSLMQAPSIAEFGSRAFQHGRRLEKAVWEPQMARLQAKVDELNGKLAARSPSPESANGLRSNGTHTFDGTWEGALALAKAQTAS